MMSSGRTEHGKHAVAFAETVSEFTPMMPGEERRDRRGRTSR